MEQNLAPKGSSKTDRIILALLKMPKVSIFDDKNDRSLYSHLCEARREIGKMFKIRELNTIELVELREIVRGLLAECRLQKVDSDSTKVDAAPVTNFSLPKEAALRFVQTNYLPDLFYLRSASQNCDPITALLLAFESDEIKVEVDEIIERAHVARQARFRPEIK